MLGNSPHSGQEIVLPSQIPTDAEDQQLLQPSPSLVQRRSDKVSELSKHAASLLEGEGLRDAALVVKQPVSEPPRLLQLEEVDGTEKHGKTSQEKDDHSDVGQGPRSVVSITDFFVFWAEELHITRSEASKKALELGENELLWTTEDLFNLEDHSTFMLLPVPLHMKRWLFQERTRLLVDPAAFMSLEDVTLRRATSVTTDKKLQERAMKKSASFASNTAFPIVEATVQVNSVSRLNVLEICYDIDFTLMLDWTDPSVIGLTPDEIQTGDIFNPDVIVDNVIGNDQPIAGSSTRPRVHKLVKGRCPDGHLKKTSRYRVTLTCPDLDLWAFPFDTQVLPIRLKARPHRIQEKSSNQVDLPIILYGPEGATGACAADGLRKSGHSLDVRADLLSEFWIHSLMGMRSDPPDRWYEMDIIIFRDPRHVLWNVAFPTLMMLLFAFSVYSIPIEDIGARLENTSTCLLAMMAFQGTIKEMLPPMPYITAMGRQDETDSDVLWRGQPADYLFGTVEFWTSASREPVRLERAVVIFELAMLVLFHVTFVWYIRRLRDQGTLRREADAIGHPGVSLIEGCPQWGKRTRGSSNDMSGTMKSAGVTRRSV